MPEKAITFIAEETKAFMKTVEKGRKILNKNPSISLTMLLDTYGLPKSLIPIIEKGEENEH